jgi:ABC-type uncharacterized transport system involved in gliding motility auxiliary subunit
LWIKKRSTQFGLSLILTAIGSLVLVASLNWLAATYNVKKDLTANKIHTLSDQSLKILGDLKEGIEITVWTTGLDRMSANVDMRRFLNNFESASKGKLKTNVKNPNEDRAAAARDNVKRDNVIVVKSASGRESRIENFNDSKGEEQVINSVIQALKGGRKLVCFVTGHGELSVDDSEAQGLSVLKSQLAGATYDVKEITTASVEKIEDACEVLVVAGPRGDLLDRESKLLSSWLTGGGRMIALLGPGTLPGWKRLVGEYGVQLRNDILIDPRVNPPIAIATKNFSQDIEIVKGFNRLAIFPETSSLEVETQDKPGRTVRTFISSESYTFAKAGGLKDLKSIRPGASDRKGPLPVAVLVRQAVAKMPTEVVPSSKKPPLKYVPPTTPPTAPADKQSRWTWPSLVESAHAQDHDHADHEDMLGGQDEEGDVKSLPLHAEGPKDVAKETALIVVSNHNFVMNSFVTQVGNLDLFLNSVNFLMRDQDLMGIRPREIRQASLELTPENLRQVYATVLLIAVIFLAMGVWARMRKSAVD